MIDLRQVQAFVAVAEESSFTRAAERLHIGASGLSAQIKKLEASIGGRLFERTPRSVEPTRLGRELYLHAQDLLASAQRFSDAAKSPSEKRTIVLAIAENGVNELALTLLAELRGAQPDVDLEIRPVSLREQHRRLNDDVEVLIARPPFDGSIEFDHERIVVASDPLVFVVHSTHPAATFSEIHVEDVLDHRRLVTDWVPDTWAGEYGVFRSEGAASAPSALSSFRDAAATVSVARTACVMPRSFARTYNVPDVVSVPIVDAAAMSVEFVIGPGIDDELRAAVTAGFVPGERLDQVEAIAR